MLQAHSSSSPAGCAGRGPWWSRLSPCSPWVPHGADLHAAAPPWVEEPPVEQVDVAWRRLRPMESPRRSRPRAGAAARGEEPTQEQGVWVELPPPVGDPCWSSLLLGNGWTP